MIKVKTFKKAIQENKELKFIYEKLNLQSSIAKRQLLESNYINDKFQLNIDFESIELTLDYINNENNADKIPIINNQLSQLNDISLTISNLENNIILDDIQLFEIKKFSFISQKIYKTIENTSLDFIILHDLNEIIKILDPEDTKISSFYIYSHYDDKLSSLRKQINENNTINENELLKAQCLVIEDRIREKLSKQLKNYHNQLNYNLQKIAYLDILLAKALLVNDLELSKPEISENTTAFKALSNPFVKMQLDKLNKQIQVIDIELVNNPILITGANMSGKTVLLRSIALAQYLFQFGFYIPANKAIMQLFDEIIFSSEDTHSKHDGLSSYAVEIINIDKIIKAAKADKKILALVDELARTTNPEEGKAIVSAFIEIMTKLKQNCIITTHYSGLQIKCKQLRVKGLKIHDKSAIINIHNINEYMDYSLEVVYDNKIPTEAIRIAEILNVDEELTILAKSKLNN